MKKRIIGIITTLALIIGISAAICVLTVSPASASSYPTDVEQASYRDEILYVYQLGGLTGLVDSGGKFRPGAECSAREFATILANLFGTSRIVPNNYSTGVITQGSACDLLTSFTRQLGYPVTFTQVTTAAKVSRGMACALVKMTIDCTGDDLKSLIVSNSNSNSGTDDGGSSLPIGSASSSCVGGFEDVSVNAWYANPVAWATDNGIIANITGTEFEPNLKLSVADMYYYLWRANKSLSGGTVCFGGVSKDSPYYTALCWAIKKGIAPNDRIDPFSTPATRADMLWCLWKLNSSPYVSANLTFKDVDSNATYAAAVRWGTKNGYISGTTSTTFEPLGQLTRASAVTLLYRCYQSTSYAGYNGVPSSDNAAYYYYQGQRYQTGVWYAFGTGWLYNGEWYLTHK